MLFTLHKTFVMAGLLLMAFLPDGCRTKHDNSKASEVDSMLNVVYSLQDTISSENVQILHEISQVLNDDLSLVYDSTYEEVINSPVTTQYASLFTDVESCALACNSYHEEIFLLEGDLRELLDLIRNESLPEDSLMRMIAYESDLLRDMQTRIDTNLEKITRNIGSFYKLKPQMDSLLKGSGVVIRTP